MQTRDFYEFGPYHLDILQRLLFRAGEPVPLTSKTFDLLLALVEGEGRVLSKEALLRRVWPDTFVEETNLTKGVFVLRQALGEAYIETLPKRGYRFKAEFAPPPAAPPQPDSSLFDEQSGLSIPPVPEAPAPKSGTHQWTWAALGVALLIGGGLIWFWSGRRAEQTIQSIAVLPFLNLSGDASREYFSDGLTVEIINALAAVPGLRVVARTSVFQFKNKSEDVRTIERKLNVDAVLEGSVRISGDQLRVTAQLNSARNGFHYWSRTWDHSMRDVFAAQQQVAGEVLRTLNRSETAPAIKPLTNNLAAYDYYLRGAFFAERVDNGKLPEALAAFEQALSEDPSFAAAYAFVARAYLRSAVVGSMTASSAFRLAGQNVRKALELDPELAAANAVQGAISFYSDWDWEEAERAFRRAIAYNPSDGNSHHEFAHYLIAMGRFEEAFVESQKQIAISPVDVEALSHVSYHYLMTGDLPRSIEGAMRALTVDPHHQTSLLFLEAAYERSGRFEEAIGVVSRRRIATPALLEALRQGWQKDGRIGYWTAFYENSRNAPMPEDLRARTMAMYCARLGRRDEMLAWLERSIHLRDTSVVQLNSEPTFAPYRKDPGFQRLVRRVGLPNLIRSVSNKGGL